MDQESLIARRIEQWSNGAWELREGSLHPVLHGIETEGLVTIAVERQGLRSRRVYFLTPEGKMLVQFAVSSGERFTGNQI